MFKKKSCSEIQNTHFMFNKFFPESRAVYTVMWKNKVEPNKPQMTIQHGACALHAGYARLRTQVHTPTLPGTHPHAHPDTRTQPRVRALTHRGICNTYSFFTASMVSRTHLNVTLLSVLLIYSLQKGTHLRPKKRYTSC
jgi:hypothetical protein